MTARLRVRRAFVAAVAGALVAMLMSGCTAARPDRAGVGAAGGPRVVVQFASEGNAAPAQVKLWAETVRDLTHGDMEIHDLTGRIEARSSFTIEATYTLRGGALTFDQFAFPGCSDCGGYAVSFGGEKPWVRR